MLMFEGSLHNKTELEVGNIMNKRYAVVKECLDSWTTEEIYNCFREVTDSIHSLEHRESFTQIGWRQINRIEQELVKIFATKKNNANLSI